jgi:hypothetical protein
MLLIFGYILLIASLICVNLNKYIADLENFKIKPYLSIFNFYKNIIDFFLLRKQNLNNQTVTKSNVRLFNKNLKIKKKLPLY